MGGSISIVFLDICVCKMEEGIVIPANPMFYKQYMDNTYVRKEDNETIKFFINLNLYRENIKLTLEINPKSF